jgi:isocitrate/isopropylmalate dehydrogenase
MFGLFEPVHGAAFDIAGKNIANPSSILLLKVDAGVVGGKKM